MLASQRALFQTFGELSNFSDLDKFEKTWFHGIIVGNLSRKLNSNTSMSELSKSNMPERAGADT